MQRGKNSNSKSMIKYIIEMGIKGDGPTHKDLPAQTFDDYYESVFRISLSFMRQVLCSFWDFCFLISYFKTCVFSKVEKYFFTA